MLKASFHLLLTRQQLARAVVQRDDLTVVETVEIAQHDCRVHGACEIAGHIARLAVVLAGIEVGMNE